MADETTYTRRQFLHRGLTFASLAATTPVFLERSASSMTLPAGSLLTSQSGVPEDHVLVVVQLGGGNDGLNTVIPYYAPQYYNLRPNISIGAPGQARNGQDGALELDKKVGVGLHPALTGMKDLYDSGVLSVIQGVGYPNPNRSHFASMDIWHTADNAGKGDGWIGRYFDNTCKGTPDAEGSVAIGRSAPLAMVGETSKPVTFESAEMFRWLGNDLHDSLHHPYEAITRRGELDGVEDDSQLAFLMRTTLDAHLSSDRIRKAMEKQPLVPYPRNALANQLRIVGAMIRDGLRTRVYYVTLGGFDTHANQPGQHANLLRQVGDSLKAFQADVSKQGNAGRVMTMVFSEFGRRVAQNASGGTDHGTAAPMYLMGEVIRPGVLGDHPSLTNLDAGDLRYGVDFRTIYAGILQNWMGADATKILGARYTPAKIMRT